MAPANDQLRIEHDGQTTSHNQRNPETGPLRFDQKLVLNQWMLWLFDEKSFEQLAEPFKSAELEGLDEDNNHKFLHQFKLLWEFEEFPGDILLGYDQNIVRHTLRLNEHRAEPIRWKYFQWLSLLFTEVYLDRFFRDPDKLLADLNEFVEQVQRRTSSTRTRFRPTRRATCGSSPSGMPPAAARRCSCTSTSFSTSTTWSCTAESGN